MTKENLGPDELTLNANSAYSRSMDGPNQPESTGPALPPDDVEGRLRNIVDDESINIDVRRAAAHSLADLMGGGEPSRPAPDRASGRKMRGDRPGGRRGAPPITDTLEDDADTEATGMGENIPPEILKKIEGWRSLYLKRNDMELLYRSPEMWIENKFNQIYSVAKQGQELDSPVIQRMQTLFGEAHEFITEGLGWGESRTETVQAFTNEFYGKLNLIFMRSSIEQGGKEQYEGMAKRVRAEGIFKAMSFEGGNVGRLYNRMQEAYDDYRLAVGGPERKLSPEFDSRFQDKIEQEEWDLASRGIGPYKERYKKISETVGTALTPRQIEILQKEFEYTAENYGEASAEQLKIVREQEIEEKTRLEIKRAIRTAYDLLVITQRHAVINARSGALDTHSPGDGWRAYLGQPGGVFNVFNAENMLWEEYNIYNEHDQEFVARIKIDLARDDLRKRKEKAEKRGETFDLSEWEDEHKLEAYGKVLFRDLYAVADFYSSGWRMNQMIEHLDEYGSQAGFDGSDFGLFVRLRANSDERSETWGKIAKYRSEEIVKIFRDRDNDKLSSLYGVFRANGIQLTDVEKDAGLTEYDKFKEEYGSILSVIRNKNFKAEPPRQTNFTNLNEEEKTLIDQTLGVGAAGRVKAMYGAMQNFADASVIRSLVNDPKFGDLYTRTLVADDILLEQLERRSADFGLTPLSSALGGTETRFDALVRNFNDLGHAGNATTSLLQFIKTENGEEKAKAAVAFAEEASMYGGQDTRAKAIRFTLGSYLNLTKKGWIWDVMDENAGPMRHPISDLQKIYGPQAEAISRTKLRHKLDEIHLLLVKGSGAKNPEEYYKDLEDLLEVHGRDINKMKAFGILIDLLLIGLLAVPAIVKESLDDKELLEGAA